MSLYSKVELFSLQTALLGEKDLQTTRSSLSATPELVSRCLGVTAGWKIEGLLALVTFSWASLNEAMLDSVIPALGQVGRYGWMARLV
jgi:hypothetical protein